MILNGKDIKDMTKEEIDNFLKDMENNPLLKVVTKGLYGSVIDNLKNTIEDERMKLEKEKEGKSLNTGKIAKDDIVNSTKIANKINMVLHDNNPSGITKNTKKVNQNIEKNNIGKRCKIYGHEDIRDGREGIIQDIVNLSQQYVININSNIIYANFEQVKIIDEWEDIEIKGVDEVYGEFLIVFKKDSIKIIIFNEDWSEDDDEYELNLGQDIREKLVQNLDKNKDIVAKFIIEKFKREEIKKEYESVCERIKGLENKRDKIKLDYESCDVCIKLLKEME